MRRQMPRSTSNAAAIASRDRGWYANLTSFITGYGNIPTTVQAMKAGAIDFLTKPLKSDTSTGLVPAMAHS